MDMSLDTQSLASLFALNRDAVIALQDGAVLFANPAAQKEFSVEPGADAALFRDFLPADAGDSYLCSGVLAGKSVRVAVTRTGAITLLTIMPQENTAAFLPLHDQMLRTMSRDLMSMRMSADLLLRSLDLEKDEKLRYYSSVLYHSYYRIKRLYEHLNLANFLLCGDQPFEPHNLDPDALFARVCDSVSRLIRDRGIKISFRAMEGRRLLSGDAKLLETLLLNLLTNSLLHASPDDEIHVTISTQNRQIILAVDDPGPGIPPEQLSCLMEPLPEPSLTDPAAGEGLGLLIVREIAALHGGSLLLESREHQGTRIRVTFPGVDAENIITMNQTEFIAASSGADPLLTELSPVLDNSIYTQKYFD